MSLVSKVLEREIEQTEMLKQMTKKLDAVQVSGSSSFVKGLEPLVTESSGGRAGLDTLMDEADLSEHGAAESGWQVCSPVRGHEKGLSEWWTGGVRATLQQRSRGPCFEGKDPRPDGYVGRARLAETCGSRDESPSSNLGRVKQGDAVRVDDMDPQGHTRRFEKWAARTRAARTQTTCRERTGSAGSVDRPISAARKLAERCPLTTWHQSKGPQTKRRREKRERERNTVLG